MNKKVNTILGLVLAVVIAGMLIGYVFPIGMNAMNEPQSSTYTMSEGETVEVATNLNATLDNVNDTNDDVNLTLTSVDSGTTYTVSTLSTGDNTTVSTDLGDVTVYNVENVNSTTAKLKFETSPDFGWDDSTQSIYGIFGIFLILTVLMALAGWAVKSMG